MDRPQTAMTPPIRTLKHLTCIVPVYNEAKNLPQFIPQLIAECKKFAQGVDIIAIDDGSKDDTVSALKELQKDYALTILVFSRNFGKEAALTAGLSQVDPHSCATLLIDADFQHPLTCIGPFIEQWQQGYEMVYGVRLHRKDRPVMLRFLSTFFYKLIDRITPIEIPHDAGDFRLLDRDVVLALNRLTERERFMKGLYAWVGFSKIAIPYMPEERQQGQSSWGLRKLIELAITGITSFSNLPLRMWSVIGAIISSLSLLYALMIVLDTLVNGIDLPGYATITVAITFLGGIQLLSIGILGEYIARIFTEVKQRPPYIISRILTSNDKSK